MLDIKFNTRELERALVFTPKALRTELKDGLEHIRRKFFKTFKQTRLKGPPGIKATPGAGGLFVRFQHRNFPATEGMEGMGFEIFTNSKVARLHEEGGIVRGEGGNRLAVPLSARTEMFTARGKLKKRYKEPGKLKNVTVMKFKGQPFLVKWWKRKPDLRPLFVLKRQIKIRPRLGFMKTWNDLEPMRVARLNRAISQSLRKK